MRAVNPDLLAVDVVCSCAMYRLMSLGEDSIMWSLQTLDRLEFWMLIDAHPGPPPPSFVGALTRGDRRATTVVSFTDFDFENKYGRTVRRLFASV